MSTVSCSKIFSFSKKIFLHIGILQAFLQMLITKKERISSINELFKKEKLHYWIFSHLNMITNYFAAQCCPMNQLVKRADSGNFRCEAPVDSTQVHCNENPIYVFPEKELRGLSPIFTCMCLWAIYIFPGSVHIFFCSRIGRPIVGIYQSLTETWMWKLGLRPHNSFFGNICFEFSVLSLCIVACTQPMGLYYTVLLLERKGWFCVFFIPHTNLDEKFYWS